ncbi:hypothetical protein AGDE_14665 [Angomonas deanei]|nr:hypothetical protein AGDE_14665 [Angomonas deanei]|eukprot:EPY20452.1 hypothetical protein AGDE_14665 [Angomonas deanei]
MQPITNNNNNSRLSMIRGGQRDPSPPSQPPLLTPPRSKTKEDKEEKQEEEEHSTNRDSNRMNDSFVEEGRKTTATKIELSEHYDPRGDYTVREVTEKASPSPIRQDEGTSVADDHTNNHQEEVPPTVCSRLHSAVEMPHSVGTVLLPSAPAPSMTPLTPCEDSFRNSSHANSTLPSPRASAKLYQVRYQIRKEEEEKKEETVNVSSLLAKYIHPTQAEDTKPNTNDKENGALHSNKVTGVPRPLANNDKETPPVHAHRHRHHSSRRHRKSSTDHKPRSTEEDTPALVSPPVEEAEVVSLTPLRDITALLPRPVNTPLDSKTPNRADAVLPAGGSPPPRLSRRARYTSADKRRSRNNSANPPTLPQRRGPGSSSPASHGDTPVRS